MSKFTQKSEENMNKDKNLSYLAFMMTGAVLIRSVTDVFLQRRCPVCGEMLRGRERRLCLHCAADLPRTYYWRTSRNPMADRFNERLVSSFHGQSVESPRYVYAAALHFYRSEAGYAAIPQALKYQADFGMGRAFAAELGRCLAESEAFRDVTGVVPVPLHPWRRFRRGYNQAAVIARTVARELGVPLLTGLLRRRRYTRTQTRLGADAKARNVAGAFALTARAKKKMTGRAGHLLLVDDVYTTGATLEACYRTLLPLAPERISIATLAVVKE